MASQESHHRSDTEPVEVDPIWTSSRTARQIYALGEVEKVRRTACPSRCVTRSYQRHRLQDISKLLALAASSVALLTLPQTDGPDDNLPQGGERSEQFVLEVSEYFERLDVSPHTPSESTLSVPLTLPYVLYRRPQSIHIAIRSSLAHIRQSRIAPSAINAPPAGFVPPSLGIGLPPPTDGPASADKGGRGLQEERVERDAWNGILDALTRLKQARDRERDAQMDERAG